MDVFYNTVIPLALVGCEIIIVNSALGASLAVTISHPARTRGIIAAAVSEPEVSERGSSNRQKNYIIGTFNHFFLPNARNCGYARLKDLGRAMGSQGVVVKCEWKI